jgi:hypothetical protein
MLALMSLLFWRLARDKHLSRRDGIFLLCTYGAYLTAVIILAILAVG